MAREPLAVTLNTLHNVTYYQRLMAQMRTAIASDTFAVFATTMLSAEAARRGEGATSCPV
jgi:tRNA-guanine family transglycosylase